MTAQTALQAVANYCKLHQNWLERAIHNPEESEELKAALNGFRLGGLEELDSIRNYIDELLAEISKKERQHGSKETD